MRMWNSTVSFGFAVTYTQPLGFSEPFSFTESIGFGVGFAVCFYLVIPNWCASYAGAPATKLLED